MAGCPGNVRRCCGFWIRVHETKRKLQSFRWPGQKDLGTLGQFRYVELEAFVAEAAKLPSWPERSRNSGEFRYVERAS